MRVKWGLLLVLLLMGGLAWSQTQNAAVLLADGWENTTTIGKLAFINGVYMGILYTVLTYEVDHPLGGYGSLRYLVPENVEAGRMMNLIDRVYRLPEWRHIPVLQIIIQWEYFLNQVGG